MEILLTLLEIPLLQLNKPKIMKPSTIKKYELKKLALGYFPLSPLHKAQELMESCNKYAHTNPLLYRKESFDKNRANLSILICNEIINNTANDRYNDIDFSVFTNIYYQFVKDELLFIIANANTCSI